MEAIASQTPERTEATGVDDQVALRIVQTDAPSTDHVPTHMQQLKRWVVWRQEERNGKSTKVPYNARTHNLASSTDLATWSSFADACAAMEMQRGYNGIGFVLSAHDLLVGVDLDLCIVNGRIEPWAQAIIEKINSYTEVSPSGNGIRIFVQATMPDRHRCKQTTLPQSFNTRSGHFEIYSKEHYLTVTTKHLQGTPFTAEGRQHEIEAIYREVFCEGLFDRHEPDIGTAPQSKVLVGFQGEDDELVETARKADNGEKFKKLFDEGDIDEYGDDDSRADMALVSILAFFAGPDPGRIDRLFRRSALVRAKWTQRQDYRDRTIETALKKCRRFYEPRTESPLKAAKNNKPWKLTDLGNARRLGHYFGRDVRYCAPWGKWLIWNGARWTSDESGEIFRYAFKTIEKLWDECKAATDSDIQAAIAKWHRTSQTRGRIDSMIHLARSLPGVAVTPDVFDKDPMLLNCPNGTVDLRTGTLRPHDPANMLTRRCAAEYDPEASCGQWLKVLGRIMAGNEFLIGYLQRFFGYCLTGLITEQILPIFYGTGANGKNTVCDTVTAIMGDYAGEAPPDLLVIGRNEHPTEVADLCGRRLVIASETEQGSKMRIQMVKRLTGNARLKARYMRCDYFEFPRTHKMILMTNNKPTVEEKSNAIWRRLKLIPFSVAIPDREQDKDLLNKLKVEWPGILAWMVRGCLAWQRDGMMEPDEVIKATGDYRHSQDPLHDFFEQCCRFDPFAITPVSALKEKYESWALEHGSGQPLSATDFNEELRKKGCEYGNKYWGGETQKCWTGLDLRGQE